MIDLSYSQLRDFKRCPFFYKLKHVEAVKTSSGDRDKRTFVGDVFQQLIEEFYRQEWWRTPATVEAVMVARAHALCTIFTDAGAIQWDADELFKWRHRIEEAVPGIVATIKREKLLAKRTYPEYEMTLVYPRLWPDGQDVTVHGRADFIFDMGSTLTVVDGKGGSTLGRFADRDQLRLYALAVQKDPRFKRLPDRVGFWWYRHAAVVWVTLTAKTMVKFEEALKVRVREVATSPFPPTPGAKCAPCDMRLRCDAGKQYGLTHVTKSSVALDTTANFGVIGF